MTSQYTWAARITICLLLACLAGQGAMAGTDTAAEPAQVATAEPLSLTPYVEVLEDASGLLQIADVRQERIAARFAPLPPNAHAINFRLTHSAYWLRIRIANDSPAVSQQMLEIGNARLSSVDYFRFANDQLVEQIATGYERPYAQRPSEVRFMAFPLTLAIGQEQLIYLRVASVPTLDVPLTLWDAASFHANDRKNRRFDNLYIGTVLTMALFNLMLFASLRDTNYLIYVVFTLASGANIGGTIGYGEEFITAHSPVAWTYALVFSAQIAISALIQFFRNITGTRQMFPRADRVLRVGAWQFLLIIGLFLFPYQAMGELAILLAALSGSGLLFMSVWGVLRGHRPAGFFLVAFVLLLISLVTNPLRLLGVIGTTSNSYRFMELASALQMILLAFTLADRINEMRLQKEKAQAASLAAEQRLVESLRESERELEDRVTQRTAELSATVDQLKKTQHDLVEAEKLASLGSLVAGVSHELNTPIGNAITTASALEEDARSFHSAATAGPLRKSALVGFLERCADMSALLLRSCERAGALITSFKQVASDQTSEQRRSFDLRRLVEDNVAAIRPGLRHAAWQIEMDIADDIRCDSYPGPLGQILTNLIQNAGVHAFDERAAGTLRIIGRADESHAELIVADDGKGMDEATLARIFEPFFTTRLGQGGSGLGLSICHNLVAGVLGGTLHAESAPAKGTRFVARFPLTAPQKPRKDARTAS